MKHQVKTNIFKILDLLPNKLGMSIYHFLQSFSENKNIDYKLHSCEKTYLSTIDICEKLNINFENKILIEIGSGWLPILPYFFYFKAKCSIIYTFDVNTHFRKKAISTFNEKFSEKYNILIDADKNNFNLPNNIYYYPNNIDLIDKNTNADYVFSRFVLEHVPKKEIIAMHKQFKKGLQKGAQIIHFISPSDHRAYTDKSLSLQDFLKYSESEWNKIQTKFDFHNRLRLPQYIDIFESIGFEIEYLSFDSLDEKSEQFLLFSKLKLNQEFQQYSAQELTAGSIVIILKV